MAKLLENFKITFEKIEMFLERVEEGLDSFEEELCAATHKLLCFCRRVVRAIYRFVFNTVILAAALSIICIAMMLLYDHGYIDVTVVDIYEGIVSSLLNALRMFKATVQEIKDPIISYL
jgi:hypothetical protein